MKYEIKYNSENTSLSSGGITNTTTDTNFTNPKVLDVNELQDSIIVTYSRYPLVTNYSVTEEEIYKIEYSRYDGTKKILE
jgi:hypothetical protein